MLVGSLRCLKEAKMMNTILGVYFKDFFLIFSNICCWYTLELPLTGSFNVYLFQTRMFFSIDEIFTFRFINKSSSTFIVSVK